MDLKPLREYESVASWAKGLTEQWGGDPLGEDPAKLETLAAFCEHLGKDPDEIIAFCFLRKKATGEKFGSVKRREEMAAHIKAFRAASGGSSMQGRRRQSDVCSFLIHNGVLMQLGVI